MMNIGVIGAGNMGAALGKAWAKNGHTVCFSVSRDDDKLKQLAADAGSGATTGTALEAAQFGDVVFIAIRPFLFASVLTQTGAANALVGKTVITCTTGLDLDPSGKSYGLPTTRTESAAEELARVAPSANVVSAFGMIFADAVGAASENGFAGDEEATIPYCGDDPEAKATAATMIAELGFNPMDAGALAASRALETLATANATFGIVAKIAPQYGIKFLRRA